MQLKNIFCILLIVTLLPVISAKVLAQEESTTTPTPVVSTNPRLKEAQEQAESNKQKFEQVRETVKQNLTNNLCETATKRLDERLTFYEELKNDEFPRVTRILATLKERSPRLKSKGLDTTKLDADIKTLETKVATAESKYAIFVRNLQNVKNYTCGNSQGQFKTALQTAKQSHREALAAARDVRQYIRLTIMSDLRALRGKDDVKRPSPSVTVKPTT